MLYRFLLKIASFLIVNIGVTHAVLAAPAPTSATLQNPLKYSSIAEIINAFLGIVTQITLPVITLFIIYSGYLFVTARGNERQIENAKRVFIGSIIGAAIILGAFVISSAVSSFAASLRSS